MSTNLETIDDVTAPPPAHTSSGGHRSPTPATSASAHHRASRSRKPESSPWSFIIVGFCLGFAGGVGVALGSVLAFLGFVAIGVGCSLSAIGVIAEGIRHGARWVSYDQGE